ncbi:tyrosine-protein phosphatase non-receptor type 23 [Sitophilus oryzae]|uniref:Tyrosine-protein phosphatase non-receptor type 23 n=1 Tax=Sitophilus oryzae TaxID=7048 RepID=A0A6J2X994_SITOR|nr:tyrosine-protein phosphatase non-receptor type 23 [Sitophilus oryzae]
MEAAPRLPMISFDLLSSTESVQFGKKLKPYIANFYNEDPESYTAEINQIDTLRASITHPSPDVSGVQLLKKYYCQLHFLKSRFPMELNQPCFIEFEWRDCQNGATAGSINFELMAVMYNIGALHTILGAQDSRTTPDGMKLAYSHFQCAAWAFQVVKDKYYDLIACVTSIEVPLFYKKVCLAQAQECILEKSMLDNRKSTIISKVAVQVYDYYREALNTLKGINEDIFGRSRFKEYMKYFQFKLNYHRCISLLFQGQQAEELQKMGERAAFYQAACEQLEEARKQLTSKQQKELADALAFTADVVEGKRKAAKNENEYIYHEEVPDIANLQEVKGAPLVKLIEFNVNDPEVSGPDIFARLVPMEAHEASSLYSEKKAQLLRNMGEEVEVKDQELAEFMSSMQLDMLTKMHQASGIPQELIDRAAALSAKPNAIQDLVDSMAKLSSIYHDVEANLNEIEVLLKEEEDNEKSYQEIMGKRPPSIITTDLARESYKYKEAHNKANESNQTLKKAMMTHMENLKILQTPIRELQQRLPSVELPDANIDQNLLKELELLNSKVDEMKTQRAMLWAQLRDSVHNDDITNALVTKPQDTSLEQLFTKELDKHTALVNLLLQNLSAQENIRKAFIDCYAGAVNTRRYIQDIIQKRNSTVQALIASHDSYDDLLAKANKGIEFYTKLETNVSKLLQRIKGASKVQQEEREQMLAKSTAKKADVTPTPVNSSVSSAPKLKDYLEARKKAGSLPSYQTMTYGGISQNLPDSQNWPPSVRPAPVGSEINSDPTNRFANENTALYYQQTNQGYGQPSQNSYNSPAPMTDLTSRMGTLMSKPDQASVPVVSNYNTQYSYSNYIPQNYTPTSYTYASQVYTDNHDVQSPTSHDSSKANTSTTNSYNTISSYMPNVAQNSENTNVGAYSGYGQPAANQKSVQLDETASKSAGNQQTQYSSQQYSQSPYSQYQNSSQYAQNYQNQNSQLSQYYQSQNASQYPQQQYAGASQQQGYVSTGQQPNYAGSTQQQQYNNTQNQQQAYASSVGQQQYATPTQQYPSQNASSGYYQTSQNVNASSALKSSSEPQIKAPGPESGVVGQQTPSNQQQGYVSTGQQPNYAGSTQQQQYNTQNQLQAYAGTGQQSNYPSSVQQQQYSSLTQNQQTYEPTGQHSNTRLNQQQYATPSQQYPQGGIPQEQAPTLKSSSESQIKAPGPESGALTQQTLSNQQVGVSGTYGQYQNMSYPQTQTPGYASQQQGTANMQQTYYPYGYAPNFSSNLDTASQNLYNVTQYQNQYYTQEHATSVASSNINNYSTYSAPHNDYKVQTGSPNVYNMSTGVSQAVTSNVNSSAATTPANYSNYGSVYGYSQANYPATVTTVSYTNPTMTAQTTSNKDSNIDLLSGLDFSVSQIPTLTPQQNVSQEKLKEPQPDTKSVAPSIEIKQQTPVVQVKEENAKKEVVRVLPTKPLNNSEVKSLFNQELEKYEKYVETLTTKTLSGPTTLDVKWKEIQDWQELDNQKRIISVARCYPMKNRYPDILPYDYSRVELKYSDDDYINASFIEQLSPFSPQFIVTQAPLASTFSDFWTMVREQQAELIFCPLNEKEIGDDIYWPTEKGKNISISNMVLSLQSMVVKPNWIERLILISIPEKKESSVVMHLQFTSWPGSLFPTSPEPFISYVLELISLFQQQKTPSHPIVVHCSSGIGRSGLLCLLTNAILQVTNQANAIPDLALLTSKLGNFRKNILRDREHLRFAYEALLCYMKQVLLQDTLKKKLSEVVPVKEEPKPTPEVQENIIDPLSTLDPFWASKK